MIQAVTNVFTQSAIPLSQLQCVLSSQPQVDYQINSVMKQAQMAGVKPQQLAQDYVDQLRSDDLCQSFFSDIEVAGPGFINLRIANSYLSQALSRKLTRNSLQKTLSNQTVICDYSSPNIAKEMHVGHLRGTVIGDCISRIYEALGAKVIRQNHVGDWGTQFGMLIEQLRSTTEQQDKLQDIEVLYRSAKQQFDSDTEFANRARNAVVELQKGEAKTLAFWRRCVDISMRHCQQLYRRLGVKLGPDDVKGESSYNAKLPQVIDILTAKGLISKDGGAKVVFLEQFKNKDGDVLGIIVQKADGAYLYMTTDLAAVQHRIESLSGNKLLYFIDMRQSLHMEQLFAIVAKIGWDRGVELQHCAFGTMTDGSGKPFKTREGGVIKLSDLLDEAIVRTEKLMRKKETALSEQELKSVASKIAIGSIKYADLSKIRVQNYSFNWDKMLSFEGNTAPYLLYAYTRIQQILYKFGDLSAIEIGRVSLINSHERNLGIHLLQFEECLEKVTQNCFPHELCTYLYQLATLYMRFYEHCPVLKAQEEERINRLRLCKITARILHQGLDLLGIEVVNKM